MTVLIVLLVIEARRLADQQGRRVGHIMKTVRQAVRTGPSSARIAASNRLS